MNDVFEIWSSIARYSFQIASTVSETHPLTGKSHEFFSLLFSTSLSASIVSIFDIFIGPDRVRSLAMLVSDSLTHSLTDSLPFSKLD